MIVDDEPLIGSALARMLRSEHEVVSTTDARDALRLLETEQFDVIVTDLMMPGMSGMEFFEALRAKAPETARKVVFLTGGAATVPVQSFLASVENTVLMKPTDMNVLRDLIRVRVAAQCNAATR